eukprot:1390097-Alexandrium_andersonii.AAC.1
MPVPVAKVTFMHQGAEKVHQEHLQKLAHVRLFRGLPADGLQQPGGPLQVQRQHGQDQEVLPEPSASGDSR